MATTFKVLGQLAPSGNTQAQLYAVPSSKSSVISTVNVCNRNIANATFRIAVQPANIAITNTHYVAYDALVQSNDTLSLSLGLTLSQNDVISVYANSALLTFSAFGSELS